MANNLVPGQYQIGNIVFGRHTSYPIEKVDYQGYDVNAQDFQSSLSDENRFGLDTQVPGSLVFTMGVTVNFALPNMLAYTGYELNELDFSYEEGNLGRLQKEWRGDEVRLEWGELKPLMFCKKAGLTQKVYGRPRKFQYSRRGQLQTYHNITAEFKLSDSFAYSDTEYYVDFVPTTPQTITRDKGDANSWVRFLIIGPANHPIINFGAIQIELDWNIVAGKVVEVNTYPWSRRVIDSDNLNLSPKLIAASPFLDQIKLPPVQGLIISWNATGTDGNSKMVLLWHDGYQVIF